MLLVMVLTDQLPHVFAAGAVTTLPDLLIDEGLECVGQGNVHGAHGASLASLAKFGKIPLSQSSVFAAEQVLGGGRAFAASPSPKANWSACNPHECLQPPIMLHHGGVGGEVQVGWEGIVFLYQWFTFASAGVEKSAVGYMAIVVA
jgi:hypothetical protein